MLQAETTYMDAIVCSNQTISEEHQPACPLRNLFLFEFSDFSLFFVFFQLLAFFFLK